MSFFILSKNKHSLYHIKYTFILRILLSFKHSTLSDFYYIIFSMQKFKEWLKPFSDYFLNGFSDTFQLLLDNFLGDYLEDPK